MPAASKHTALAAALAAIVVILTLTGHAGAVRDVKWDRVPPSAPTNLRVTAVTPFSVSLAWDAASDDVDVVGYYLYIDRKRTRLSSTTFTAQGLQCGRSVSVRVVAYDAANNRSAATYATAATAPCPDLQSPTTPASFRQQATTQNGVVLAWDPSSDNVGVVGYGVYRNFVLVASPTDPAVTLGGLACGSTSEYAVDAVDAAGNRSPRGSVWVQTAGCSDGQAPTAPTGLIVTSHTTDSLSLSWIASTDNVGVAGYRISLAGTPVATVTQTSATLANLPCGTGHSIGVDAFDAAGNGSTAAVTTAATDACPTPAPPPPPPAGDTSPPSAPSDLVVSSATGTSMSLSWSASSDNVGVAGYGVYLDGSNILSTSQPAVTVSDLACGGAYTFAVDAYDAAGNRSARTQITSFTAPCGDVQPPSAPTNVITSSRTATSIALSWSASSDDIGVAGYGLYRDGSQLGTASGTTGIFSGLTCNTSYTLSVDAYDAAGNRSTKVSVGVATTDCPDTSPPSTPAGLAASNVSQTGLTLTWNASSDNVGVTGYDVFRNGTKTASVSSTSSGQSGLACGTEYSFAVTAMDAAGNTSAPATLTVSTPACSAPPPPGPGTLFGVHQDLVYFGGEPYWSDRMNVATALGARVSRSSFLWDKIEPTRGVFDWSRADGVVNGLVSRGIAPLMVLVGSPSWANGSTDRFVIPQDPTAYATWVSNFANFARAAVARYKDRVHYWEIWNEENERYFWKPEPANAQQYIQLYNATRAAMLAADPSAKIAVGGLAGLWYSCCVSGRDFLGQMVSAGARIDYVGIHPYDGGAPGSDTAFDANFTDIARIHDYLAGLGLPNVRLWATEWGWKDQPAYLQESLEMIRDNYPYVELATYFLDIDTSDYPGYGLYDTSMRPKPAAQTFKSFVASYYG